MLRYAKIKYQSRIERQSSITHFKVQMRAGGITSVAAEGYRFAFAYALTFVDKRFAQVGVTGFKSIVVYHNEIVTVAT